MSDPLQDLIMIIINLVWFLMIHSCEDDFHIKMFFVLPMLAVAKSTDNNRTFSHGIITARDFKIISSFDPTKIEYQFPIIQTISLVKTR